MFDVNDRVVVIKREDASALCEGRIIARIPSEGRLVYRVAFEQDKYGYRKAGVADSLFYEEDLLPLVHIEWEND
jgi:hypothetical protein